jgi:hypothetical protein
MPLHPANCPRSVVAAPRFTADSSQMAVIDGAQFGARDARRNFWTPDCCGASLAMHVALSARSSRALAVATLPRL